MKPVFSAAVVIVVLMASQAVWAQEQAKCPATCNQSKSAGTGDDCAKCPMSAAMEKLPKMVYKVGDETTSCCQSAADLAKKAEQPIHYIVGEKTFEKEDLAYVALVEQTEAFVNEFTTPSKCETSGVTKIAGESCGCPMQAAENTKLVKTAVEQVKMTYVVGEQESHCPDEAKQLAAKSNAKTTYVVGDAKTSCDLEARLNLARAKYKAAVHALAKSSDAKKADTSDF